MKNKLFYLLLSFIFSFTAFAETNRFTSIQDTTNIEKKLLEASQKTDTISSDFIQEKHLEYLDAVITSKGKFWFKKQSYLRWEYVEPFSYAIILNNDIFVIKDADKRSEFDLKANTAFKEVIELISGAVQGNLMKDDKFTVKAFESSSQYMVEMTPKQTKMKSILRNISMIFNKADLSVQKIKMVESEEDYTEITFINRKINEKIPESVFAVQ